MIVCILAAFVLVLLTPHGVTATTSDCEPLAHLNGGSLDCCGLSWVRCSQDNASILEIEAINIGLAGSVPDPAPNLWRQVTSIAMVLNSLSGTLPSSLFLLPSLISLSLNSNMLSGSLPATLFANRNLTLLSLVGNEFTGRVPHPPAVPQGQDGYALQTLDLSNNRLSSSLLPGFADPLEHLVSLVLTSNLITSPLFSLERLAKLQVLAVGANRFTGQFPDLSHNLALRVLHLDRNSFRGELPYVFPDTLESIMVNENYFSGTIPSSFCQMRNLWRLILSNNVFSGAFPSCCWGMKALKYLNAASNEILGSMPDCICSLPIQDLAFSYNRITSLPSCLGQLQTMSQFHFRFNRIRGTIPEGIYDVSGLYILSLSGNYLTGTISPKIANLRNLNGIHMYGNQLTGSLPCNITSSPKLQYLSLHQNKLTGTLCSEWFRHPTLLSMQLSENLMEGTVPSSFWGPNALSIIQLYNNHFTGTIPVVTTHQPGIRILNIAFNKFSGRLWPLDSLPAIQLLNMEHNDFTSLGDSINVRLSTPLFANFSYNAITVLPPVSTVSDLALDISGNLMADNLAAIVNRLPSQVIELFVADCGFSGPIGSLQRLRSLQRLDLSRNNWTGHIVLSSLPKTLETLIVSRCEHLLTINDVGGTVVMPNLAHLDVSYTKLLGNDLVFDDLKRSFPNLLYFYAHHTTPSHVVAPAATYGLLVLDLSYVPLRTMTVHVTVDVLQLIKHCITCLLDSLLTNISFSVGAFVFGPEGAPRFPRLSVLRLRGCRIESPLFFSLISDVLMTSYSPICTAQCAIVASLFVPYGYNIAPPSGRFLYDIYSLITEPSISVYSNIIDRLGFPIKFLELEGHPIAMSQIMVLDLGENRLSGGLSFTNVQPSALASLEELRLDHNELSGDILWTLFSSAPQLRILDLGSNLFEGNLPSFIATSDQWNTLRHLYLADLPLITIEAPNFHVSVLQMETLDLSLNPGFIGELSEDFILTVYPNLLTINLSYCPNLRGAIPRSLWCGGTLSGPNSPCFGDVRQVDLNESGFTTFDFYPSYDFLGRLSYLEFPGTGLLCDPPFVQAQYPVQGANLPATSVSCVSSALPPLLGDACSIAHPPSRGTCLNVPRECGTKPINFPIRHMANTPVCTTPWSRGSGVSPFMCWDHRLRFLRVPAGLALHLDLRPCSITSNSTGLAAVEDVASAAVGTVTYNCRHMIESLVEINGSILTVNLQVQYDAYFSRNARQSILGESTHIPPSGFYFAVCLGEAAVALLHVVAGAAESIAMPLSPQKNSLRIESPLVAHFLDELSNPVSVTGTLHVRMFFVPRWKSPLYGDNITLLDMHPAFWRFYDGHFESTSIPVTIFSGSVALQSGSFAQFFLSNFLVSPEQTFGVWLEFDGATSFDPSTPRKLQSGHVSTAGRCHPTESTWFNERVGQCEEFCDELVYLCPPGSACPYGNTCDGTSSVCITQGFWREQACFFNGSRGALVADECVSLNPNKTCPGGNASDIEHYGAGACAAGHEGRLCAQCSEGFVYSVQSECLRCVSTAAAWAIFLVFVIAIVAWNVAITASQMYAGSHLSVEPGTAVTSSSSSLPRASTNSLPRAVQHSDHCHHSEDEARATAALSASGLSLYLKLFLSTLQTSVIIGRLEISWPGPVASVRSLLDIAVSALDIVWLRCIFPVLTQFSFRFYSLLAVYMVLQLTFGVCCWYLYRKKRSGWQATANSHWLFRSSLLPALVSSFLYCLYQPITNVVALVFITVPSQSARFAAELAANPNTTSSVVANKPYEFLLIDIRMQVIPPDRSWYVLSRFAYAAVFVCLLGYPLLVMIFLRRFKPWLKNCRDVFALLGIYLSGYESHAIWFELFRMARTSLSVLASVTTLPSAQLMFILILLLAEASMTAAVRPYSGNAQYYQMIALSAQILQLIVAIIFLQPEKIYLLSPLWVSLMVALLSVLDLMVISFFTVEVVNEVLEILSARFRIVHTIMRPIWRVRDRFFAFVSRYWNMLCGAEAAFADVNKAHETIVAIYRRLGALHAQGRQTTSAVRSLIIACSRRSAA